MWYGIGNTVIANPSTMRGALRCDAARGGHLFLYNGAQEIGQGTATIMPQMFADAVGLPLACVEQVMGDTDLTADAGKSSASRQTFVSGNAARAAGHELRRQLLERLGFAADGEPASRCGSTAHRLVARRRRRASARSTCASSPADAERRSRSSASGHFNPPTVPLDADGQGVPTRPTASRRRSPRSRSTSSSARCGCCTSTPRTTSAARSTRPRSKGQIHGGIAQGIGMALMEEYVNGRTDNLHDYLIPTVGDVPPITVHLIEDPEPLGPWGAKGVGEPALVATAPAILNAIHARDRRAHARGAGDAEPAARGDRSRRGEPRRGESTS